MLMQKHSPNKIVENDDINVNSMDSLHSNGHFIPGQNPSSTGSDGNDDKSNDLCSSDDESHEHDNTEQENQTSIIDGSNREHFKSSLKKKNKKIVKVKFADSPDDKTGIKLKIRRTNNFNQDENHVIVDNAEHQRKRHLKNKRCKSLSQDGVVSNGASDDNLSHKHNKPESDEESRMSVGMNTMSKGTEIDDLCLGPCQAGTKLSLESVVLMETKSGILIVSVQWRGKTLMGALMESDRFQIGSLEKDSIYRRDKLIGINRRNNRRKSKNLFGKKKRKLTTPPPDSGEHAGTENETGNSDGDNPYICDKQSCHMKFADFQTLRVHIYQKHRLKGQLAKNEYARTDTSLTSHHNHHQTKSAFSTNLVTTEEDRNTFSPAYSDISDANEAPVLENEAELKPSTASVAQPPINLAICQKSGALLTASNRMLFSPTAPALQPEVSICSSQSTHGRCLPPNNDRKLPHITNYRYHPLASDAGSLHNGFIHKPPNGALSLSSVSNIPTTDTGANSVQDLSVNNNTNAITRQKMSDFNNHQHKTAPTLLNCHKQTVNRHQSHLHGHHHMHSSNTINSTSKNQNSKHFLSSENGMVIHSPTNGVTVSHHNPPYMSFSQSVNNQNNKLNYPTNHMSLYPQPKY